MFQCAVFPGQELPFVALAELGVLLVMLFAARAYLVTREQHSIRLWKKVLLPTIPLVYVLQPFLWERLKEVFLGPGEPYDTQIAYSMRNLMLTLTLLPFPALYSRLASVSSLFLLLFSYSLRPDWLGVFFATLFGAVGIGYLSRQHWEGIQSKMADAETRVYPRMGLGLIILLVAVALLGGAVMARGRSVSSFLPQVFPSSGGDAQSDPRSKSGVLDGDALVEAQKNADSFGPVESELFLESNEPSLYDVFQDTFDAAETAKKTERAISLPSRDIPQKDHRIAEHQHSNNEFSTRRRESNSKEKQLEDRKSPELLQVLGTTPVHLRTHVYNAWDGEAWSWIGTARSHFPQMETIDSRPWIRSHEPLPGSPELSQFHQLRFINYRDNRIPEPERIVGAHIDLVDQPEMHRFSNDGGLAMSRDRIPRMTVMHIMSWAPAERNALEVFENATYSKVDINDPTSTLVDDSEQALLKLLAKEWTRDLPRGWRQIEAIEQRLQLEYSLEPHLRVPSDALPLEWFLRRSKAGPDYLFATVATLMLRELGYHARTVSGLYARKPTDHSGMSRVLTKDAHFWCEVSTDGVTWKTVEPSPGYLRAGQTVSLWSHLRYAFYKVKTFLWSHRASLVSSLGLVALTTGFRRRLAEFGIFVWWRLRVLFVAPTQCIEATICFFHRLELLRSRGRDRSLSLQTWLREHPWFAQRQTSIQAFLSIADQFLYGGAQPTSDHARIRSICDEVGHAAMFASKKAHSGSSFHVSP